jgi:predicted amidohydrolase
MLYRNVKSVKNFFASWRNPALKLRISMVQMDLSFGNPQENRKRVQYWTETAIKQFPHTDVILLPELWNTAYDLTRLSEIADKEGRETQAFISELAKQYQVNIVAGSIAKQTEQGVTNTLYAFDRTGTLAGEYSKVHLIRLMDEDRYLVPGEEIGLFSLDGIPCAALICYDIRFPEWVRKAVLHGAKILFIPAQWPKARLDHWQTLLRARAIENQCFVVACNRVGRDPKNEFPGHSLILDPWGNILSQGSESEQILYAELELDQVTEIRSKIPVFEDRRPHLYDLSSSESAQETPNLYRSIDK